MKVSYVEENLFQISRPAIYRQADPLRTQFAFGSNVMGTIFTFLQYQFPFKKPHLNYILSTVGFLGGGGGYQMGIY